MSCTIEKILTDAKTLLERLREHDAAAESLVDQSAALHRRVAAMREAGTALPDQVRRRVRGQCTRCGHLEGRISA
jgi:suppressor of IKK-epsilon